MDRGGIVLLTFCILFGKPRVMLQVRAESFKRSECLGRLFLAVILFICFKREFLLDQFGFCLAFQVSLRETVFARKVAVADAFLDVHVGQGERLFARDNLAELAVFIP